MIPDKDRKERDHLIEQFRSYVHTVVGRMIRAMGLPPNQYDEFVAAGNLGLVEAAERYDPNNGKGFKSFAFLRIRGAVIDCIRNSAEVTGKTYRYARALQGAQAVREEMLPALADPDESVESQLSQVMEVVANGALAFKLSFEEAETELNNIESPEDDPEIGFTRKSDVKKIVDLVDLLPPRERLIIREFYFNEKSFSAIARENRKMGKSWVSRLHARALVRLRRAYFELSPAARPRMVTFQRGQLEAR